MRWVHHKIMGNIGGINAEVMNVYLYHYSIKILIKSPQLDKWEWFC